MEQPKRLFLIDGMAILFRGYFALMNANLVSRGGEPSGATFAFCTALIRLLEYHKPELIAVAWDTAGPTFRHEQYTDYKANRPDFPPDLVPQLKRVKEIVKLYHIPSLELPGYEADDIIGTLALRAADAGYTVYCVTPDKDYLQLVRENVFVYKPSRPGADEEIVDIAGVHTRFGVRPEQVIDVLALVGDTADNVPGVKGIGEKTAIPLIQQFGSVESIYENIEAIEKAGVRKKLTENRESAFMSKELVTIHTNCTVDVTFEELHLDPPDVGGLLRVYDELGFKTLAKRYQEMAETIAEAGGSVAPPSSAGPAAEAAEEVPDGVEPETPPDADAMSFSFDYGTIRTIADVPHTYVMVGTEEQLAALVGYLATGTILSFDLETDSLDWATAHILGFSFSIKPGEAFYVPIWQEEVKITQERTSLFDKEEITQSATQGLPLDVALRYIKPLLENPSVPKTGQNAKFDMTMLRRHEVCVAPLAFDSMLASYILDSTQSHGMDALSERHLGYRPISITELIGKGKEQITLREVNLTDVAEYAAEDADVTLQLTHRLGALLKEQKLEDVGRKIEFPLVEALVEMEYCGVSIDVEALKDISRSLEGAMARVEQEIYEAAGRPFNIGSTKQLADILFVELKLPSKKKTKTGYSTDQFVMEELASLHPLPEKILEYRQAAKLKSTYVDALPSMINPTTGKVHSSYNQAVTSTGRLSSNNPNLQNIPIRSEIGQEIRKAFVSGQPDGVILSADYSQIELRIMAHICGDEALVRAFKENFDIHTATAMNVFNVAADEVTGNMRRKAKEVNFGIMYGIGPFGLARRLKIGKTEAQELIRTYFAKYPGVQQYIASTLEKARLLGYVETLGGRRRYYPNINVGNPATRGGEERAAINMPIQGTASDIIKLAMIDIHRSLRRNVPSASMIMQVHDELVFDVARDEAEGLAAFVKEKMENSFPLGEVPLIVETGIGKNWFEAH